MKKITRRQFIKRGILTSLILGLLDSFWFEIYFIKWNEFDISKQEDSKIKIMQLSDLHFNKLRSYHKSIAKEINKVEPDLLVITGDVVDKVGKIDALNEFLQLINFKIKKFAITGNWEYWGRVDLQKLKVIYTENNCELLINENRTLTIKNRKIAIIGIDDLVGGNADYPLAIQGLSEADTNIVLTHCPMHRDVIATQKGDMNIDLLLCGHTHGGQVAFLGYAPITPVGSGRYVGGWYKDKSLPTYVSRGIGTSIIPVRFGARAEMVTFLV
jgi:predicted MPP superfamily phosphohydrolase